ncbi:hypothetical protein O181_080512 [Austropuccinia psidii MF-1]|uniref:Tc1-like transposase DDE domain-containing protein n=1 Tax=Austropuccinia psidii MF-1 TaxID=1389203 RepID=A0A9Q3FP12_9BASI|nr:hypothetical protein [Austropuccinia psidii MF-1]
MGTRQAGLSSQAIGQLAGVPLTIIYNTVSKYQQIGTVQMQQKTGQPTILKDRDQHQLSQIITHCRHLTFAEVTNLMTESVSTRTIQQEIHKLGLPTSSLSFHQPNGARTLDHGKTQAYCHGRQCPNPHSNSQKSMGQQHGIQKMQWTAHSPDLNPIENVWKIMKSAIRNLYQPQTIAELQVAIQSAWDDVPHETLDNLLLSMQWQMEMVIAQRGGPTSY